MSIPGGAFPDCAKLETAAMPRPDGKPATAFNDRSEALKAMRSETIALRDEVDDLKQEVAALPFPFGAR